MQVSLSQVNAALNRLKNCLPRSSLDALYSVAELVQTPEFEIGQNIDSRKERGPIQLLTH